MSNKKLSITSIVSYFLAGIVLLIVVFALFNIVQMFRGFGGIFTGDWNEAEFEEEIEGTFTNLVVKNISGKIEINGWDKDYVKVDVIKNAPSEDGLEELEYKIQLNGDTLLVERLSNVMDFGSISFTIFVPEHLQSIGAYSVSGSITLSDIHAGVDQVLETISGSIKTDNANNLSAGTVSGAVKFVFSGRELKINTLSGSIHGDIPDIETNGSLELSSISGSINISVFDGLDAVIDLSSISGSINCDFKVITSSHTENKIIGTIRNGAIPITISTTSGSISIKKL